MAQPHLSVFTPSHRPTWLDECLHSLRAQDRQDWEWVVMLVDGARWRPPVPDKRVHVFTRDDIGPGVGAAKRAAVEACRGDILVELDHDDLLTPAALDEIAAAFAANPDAAAVYSDFAQVTADGGRDESRFSGDWDYYDVTIGGRTLLACRAKAATPANVSYVWYAPNHVRAFRRSAYDEAGGYDPTRDICDDHDLLCRLYQRGPFIHIEECLYLQRIHHRNTQREPDRNAAIQAATVDLYEQHVEANALAWARRGDLVALDLGAAHNPRGMGYLGVDLLPGDGVALVCDATKLPFDDNEVGVIRAVDFLEHVYDPIAMMNEIHRVLAPDGMLLSLTPSTDGRGAFQDPTHVSYWNEHSFWYYTDPDFTKYVPDFTGHFHVSRLRTYHPSAWHEEHRIPYVQANLIAAETLA